MSSLVKAKAESMTRYRDLVFGYVDCSEAPLIAQNYLGCGVPIPKFACSSLDEAAEKCMNLCEKQNKCEFISIYQNKDTCMCSLKTIHSLIESSRVIDADMSHQDQYFCNEMVMMDPSGQLEENCDGTQGCVQKKKFAYTIAKDINSWSFVDTCTLKLPSNLRKKSEKKALKHKKKMGKFGDKDRLLPPSVRSAIAAHGGVPHKHFPGLKDPVVIGETSVDLDQALKGDSIYDEGKYPIEDSLKNANVEAEVVRMSDLGDGVLKKMKSGDKMAINDVVDMARGRGLKAIELEASLNKVKEVMKKYANQVVDVSPRKLSDDAEHSCECDVNTSENEERCACSIEFTVAAH